MASEIMPQYQAFIDLIFDDLQEARRLANTQNDYMAVVRSHRRNEVMPLHLAEEAAAHDDGDIMAVAAPGLNIDTVLEEAYG